jgi:hypothetical protein
MAQQTIHETIVNDDFNPEITEGVENVRFSYKGVEYEIDLGGHNLDEFDTTMQPYIEAGRKVVGAKRAAKGKGTSGRRVSADRERSTAIRTWAASHGHTLGNRGRIPSEIVEAYEQAHAA